MKVSCEPHGNWYVAQREMMQTSLETINHAMAKGSKETEVFVYIKWNSLMYTI